MWSVGSPVDPAILPEVTDRESADGAGLDYPGSCRVGGYRGASTMAFSPLINHARTG